MGNQPAISRAVRTLGFGLSILFYGFFLLLSGIGLFVFGRTLLHDSVPYGWTEVTATVDESRVAQPKSEEDTPAPYVRYHYSFGGRTYSAETLSLDPVQMDTAEVYAWVQRFPAGRSLPCYVNPSAPTQVVLFRKSLSYGWVALVPLGLAIFALIGLLRTPRQIRAAESGPGPVSATALSARRTRWFLVFFFGIFLVAGGAATYFGGVKPLLRVYKAQSWSEVPCTIVSSRVRVSSDEDGPIYRADIVYQYRVQGRIYTANRLNFMLSSGGGAERKRGVVASFPAGSTHTCYVDPGDPVEAVLDRSLHLSIVATLLPLLFFAVGVFGLISTLKTRKQAKTGGLFTHPFVVSAAPVDTVFMEEGRVQTALKPMISRSGKVIVLLAIGLFWNGIVSVFVFHLATNWHGRENGFLALFLAPFVLIGIALWGAAAHQALALLNPRIELSVTNSTLRLGDTVDIAWRLQGRAQRLRRLQVRLTGREEATYGAGSSNNTAVSVFASIEVVDTVDPREMNAGSTRITIPADTMHSFKSKNNRIVWEILVRGDIPRWPNIADDFPLTVLPLSLHARA